MSALLLSLLLATAPALADAEGAYAQGITALRDGQPEAAADAFARAHGEGARSADLYHALGNAWYRSGERGRALAAWRRGQQLDPGNGDLAANVAHARGENLDRLDPPEPRLGPFLWLGWLAPGRVLLAGAALLGLALSLGALGTWRRRRGQAAVLPRVALGAGLLGLVLAASPFLAAPPASVVVVAEEVEAVSALGGGGVVLFELHEGAEVARLEADRAHVLVALPDGRKGWLPEAAVLSTDPAAALPQVPRAPEDEAP